MTDVNSEAARQAGPAGVDRAKVTHGGAHAVAAARQHGVTAMFTLSGGHVFPLYDGAVKADPPMRLVDVRHEQTAVFAAEATARLTRSPGFAVVTAGPGVTNAVSAITTAHFNGSPVVVLGGRAPDYRWGSGSLQEIDHPPLLAPVTKRAWTEHQAAGVGAAVDEAFQLATAPHQGPVFLDIALEALFGDGGPELPGARAAGTAAPAGPVPPDPGDVAEIAELIAGASRPVLVLGSDVWLGGAEAAASALVSALRLPVIANGQGRGVLPARHDLLVTRARSVAFAEADLVVVAGAPLDFRLGYGEFGGRDGRPPARVVHVADSPEQIAAHATLAASAAGDLSGFFTALASAVPAALRRAGAGAARGRARSAGAGEAERGGGRSRARGREKQSAGAGEAERGGGKSRAGGGHLPWEESWLPHLAAAVAKAVAADQSLLAADTDPIHPMRIYGELTRLLDDDAVVVGDGGDFVSYAGKYIEPKRPGGWLDPGPYGCLGTGLGYAIAARIARPSAQVVLLLGDGAAGFSLMDADTLVRHGLGVVMICGNNGIWALEKYPMQALYGYDVVADLQQGCRYDEVVRALGGAGETVTRPGDIAPALRRAFDAGVPYLVNVITDPTVAYPRSTTGV